MSWQAVADVLENSPSYGADRLVEIAIAERANEDGGQSFGSAEDIARRANVQHFRAVDKPDPDASEEARDEFQRLQENATRSVRRSVRKLEELSRIEHYETTAKGVRVYRIVMGTRGGTLCPGGDTVSGVQGGGGDEVSGTPDEVSGVPRTTGPGTPDEVSPKPSLNPNPKSQLETKQQSSSSKKEQQQRAAKETERRQLLDARGTLEGQLERKAGHGPTLRALEQVHSELLALDVDPVDIEAAEHEVDVWARRLAEQVTITELVPA